MNHQGTSQSTVTLLLFVPRQEQLRHSLSRPSSLWSRFGSASWVSYSTTSLLLDSEGVPEDNLAPNDGTNKSKVVLRKLRVTLESLVHFFNAIPAVKRIWSTSESLCYNRCC